MMVYAHLQIVLPDNIIYLICPWMIFTGEMLQKMIK
jgi:hypothetical protein